MTEIVLGVLLVGTLAACGSTAPRSLWPRLVVPGSGSGGVAAPSARAGVAYSFGAMQVCIRGPRGAVSIESVKPVDARGGLHVSGYGVWRPGTSEFGADKVQVAAIAGFDAHREPTGRCSQHRVDTIVVQVDKPHDTFASSTGFELSYRSGGSTHTVLLPLGVALCARSAPHRDCTPPAP
ncbi:MAG TPA: hypothetical protein VF426_08270 [Marmoricola sp.]